MLQIGIALVSALYMIDKQFDEALYSCICYLFACLTFQRLSTINLCFNKEQQLTNNGLLL